MVKKFKCWRKTADTKNIQRWMGKGKQQFIDVEVKHEPFLNENKPWSADANGLPGLALSFKTKKQATKRAKSYMRKHDKC